LDAIVQWTYVLDGATLPLPNKNIVSIPFANAGAYNLEVNVLSRMGATAKQAITVNVNANQPPVCTPTAVPSANKFMVVLNANCKDPDGAITKYQWSVNGNVIQFATGGVYVYVLPPGMKYPVNFQLDVDDDGLAHVTNSVTAN
jgi:hypothetical protein